MQVATLLTADEIRAMIREEMKALEPAKDFETITQYEALKIFREHNLPPKQRGYTTLKRMIAEGKIRQRGRRISKDDVFQTIKNILA